MTSGSGSGGGGVAGDGDGAGITLDEVLAETGGRALARVATRWDGVTIDGRRARPGDLYFAIVGERHDGHAFAAQAVAAGATGIVVARGNAHPPPEGVTVVEVEDTRVAIGQVARAVRRRASARVVGVTGSAGKTTTKELIAAMLGGVAGSERVIATEGSLNNETGVPQTLARLRARHAFAVVEMGMRGVGQIDYLTRWTEPDVGVVVNAGIAHVGVVGSVEAIARGKSEIWGGGLRPGGWAIYPAGDPRLAAHAAEKVPPERHVTFGEHPEAHVRVREVTPRGPAGAEVTVELRSPRGEPPRGEGEPPRTLTFRLPLVGRHNAGNAACALAVAVALGVDLGAAARGLEAVRPAKLRGEIETIAGRHVLVDCYNANPASTRAALETLADLAAGARAVAVLGDMLELGEHEAREHEALAETLAARGIDHLVCLGERARHTARAAARAGVAHVEETDDPAAAARVVAAWTGAGDWVLVKASRGMRLERVVEALREIGG